MKLYMAGGSLVSDHEYLNQLVLSKDDRLLEVRERVQDYLTFGVPYVWILDPAIRQVWRLHSGGRAGCFGTAHRES